MPSPSGDHRSAPDLALRLRLIVVTDRTLAKRAGHPSVEEVVRAALRGGAPAVQLRDKDASARELAAQGRRILELCRDHDALVFINDRMDVALAIGAHGVHLGPDDLPVGPARSAAPPGFLIGYSTDDPTEARAAMREGADYLGCGAVFGTSTKALGDEAIGLERLDEVARSVTIPVVGIGGVTPVGARSVATETHAAGVAVVGAVMSSPNPERTVHELLAPFRTSGTRG